MEEDSNEGLGHCTSTEIYQKRFRVDIFNSVKVMPHTKIKEENAKGNNKKIMKARVIVFAYFTFFDCDLYINEVSC